MQIKKLPVPLGNRLILQPNDSPMRGGLFIPDTYKDGSTACKVLARGNKVSPFIKTGEIVFCEAAFGDRNNNTIGQSRAFWATDLNVYAIFHKGQITPFGRKVLIRRDIEDAYQGSIVIPANRRFQSLTGTIERLGLSRVPFKVNDLKVGDKIRLTEWQAHYAQVELSDGGHGVIVKDTDILYKEI